MNRMVRRTEKFVELKPQCAKLYQAINGMSIAIELGNFSIEIKDADISEVKFHITPNKDIEEYCFLKEHVNSLLSVLSESEGIDCLMERVMFAEASHFISAPPFYIDSEGSVAEALYIGHCIIKQVLGKNGVSERIWKKEFTG